MPSLDPARAEAIKREIAAMQQAQTAVYHIALRAEAHDFQRIAALISAYVDIAEDALAKGLDYVQDPLDVSPHKARYLGEKVYQLFGQWLTAGAARTEFLKATLPAPYPAEMGHQPRVLVESPFGAKTPDDLARNIAYARACVSDAIGRGEAPYASHLFFTQEGILDDADPEQRKLGIDLGLVWGQAAHYTVVYTDLGISGGMRLGIDRAANEGRPVQYRAIGYPWSEDARPHEVSGERVESAYDQWCHDLRLDPTAPESRARFDASVQQLESAGLIKRTPAS